MRSYVFLAYFCQINLKAESIVVVLCDVETTTRHVIDSEELHENVLVLVVDCLRRLVSELGKAISFDYLDQLILQI